MKKNTIKKTVISAMVAAIVCVTTMIIKVPSPLKGYVNLGDAAVLFAGFSLSPVSAFLAAGLGSALADVFSGYAIYAPATFIIKGLMALVCYFGFKLLSKKVGSLIACIISGVLAEIVMILGYLIFESFLYGFVESLVNVPANAVQGVFGIVLGVLVFKLFEKTKISLK